MSLKFGNQDTLIFNSMNLDILSQVAKFNSVFSSYACITGGLSFYTSGDSKSTSLDDAFTTSERARMNDPRNIPVTVSFNKATKPIMKNSVACLEMYSNMERKISSCCLRCSMPGRFVGGCQLALPNRDSIAVLLNLIPMPV